MWWSAMFGKKKVRKIDPKLRMKLYREAKRNYGIDLFKRMRDEPNSSSPQIY